MSPLYSGSHSLLTWKPIRKDNFSSTTAQHQKISFTLKLSTLAIPLKPISNLSAVRIQIQTPMSPKDPPKSPKKAILNERKSPPTEAYFILTYSKLTISLTILIFITIKPISVASTPKNLHLLNSHLLLLLLLHLSCFRITFPTVVWVAFAFLTTFPIITEGLHFLHPRNSFLKTKPKK